MDVFTKNAGYTPRAEQYQYQLAKAAELSDWKKNWDGARPEDGHGARGLGIGVNTWAAHGHGSTARMTINSDGSVVLETGHAGSGQRHAHDHDAGGGGDAGIRYGPGETCGDNSLPPGGSSGGSTTIGGVSSSTRKAGVNALDKLFEAAAPALGVSPDDWKRWTGRSASRAIRTRA